MAFPVKRILLMASRRNFIKRNSNNEVTPVVNSEPEPVQVETPEPVVTTATTQKKERDDNNWAFFNDDSAVQVFEAVDNVMVITPDQTEVKKSMGKSSDDQGTDKKGNNRSMGKSSDDQGMDKKSNNRSIGKSREDLGVAKKSNNRSIGKNSDDQGMDTNNNNSSSDPTKDHSSSDLTSPSTSILCMDIFGDDMNHNTEQSCMKNEKTVVADDLDSLRSKTLDWDDGQVKEEPVPIETRRMCEPRNRAFRGLRSFRKKQHEDETLKSVNSFSLETKLEEAPKRGLFRQSPGRHWTKQRKQERAIVSNDEAWTSLWDDVCCSFVCLPPFNYTKKKKRSKLIKRKKSHGHWMSKLVVPPSIVGGTKDSPKVKNRMFPLKRFFRCNPKKPAITAAAANNNQTSAREAAPQVSNKATTGKVGEHEESDRLQEAVDDVFLISMFADRDDDCSPCGEDTTIPFKGEDDVRKYDARDDQNDERRENNVCSEQESAVPVPLAKPKKKEPRNRVFRTLKSFRRKRVDADLQSAAGKTL